MYRETGRYKVFSRRVAILGAGKLALLSMLGGRMYQLQVVEADKYSTLAEENRINLRLLAPPRGRILDRFGRPLAINKENYRVSLVSEQVPDVEATLSALSEIISLGDHDRQRILREVRRRRDFVPVTVRENLQWEEVSRIEVNAPDLPGLSIEVGQSRLYPFAHDFSHVLGYVSAVSQKEITGDPLLQLPGFKTGKNGIERVFDLDLRGKAGSSQVEVNSVGRVIRELSRQEGQPGDDLRLTIDRDLQKLAATRLKKEKSAAAVVMDIHNGDILILASVPGFDPNNFVTGLSSRSWHRLINNPHTPLINKTISGLYAPGSTFKMVVALAALEAKIIGPNHRVLCTGFTQLGKARFHCWKTHGHGWQDMFSAHRNSCDVYFYDIAKRLGIDRIADMAEKLGLGSKTGVELPSEKNGIIPTRAWKKALIGAPWQQGETLISGIGQGFVLTTPMQLAVMTARLANNGIAITPRIVRPSETLIEQIQPKFKSLGISSRSLDVVREGMNQVTNHPGGTAYRARISMEGMEMSGKTGTAQVRRISKAERETGILKSHERPWRERDHALFVGYAPSDKPRYAVSVVVEHGGEGSNVAAPIGRDLLVATQKHDPSGRKSPLLQIRKSKIEDI
ncbi:MAG: Penicillin-binding protein 2 [Alphaproteobacteria bacterium MarineAlpha11_Bin1]|nr:MAG: Penicillin-binding protein 2 [Alphaproteobacteria bacterium MarineAlpha11_Bin1]